MILDEPCELPRASRGEPPRVKKELVIHGKCINTWISQGRVPKNNYQRSLSKRKQTMGCCMSSPVTYESNTYADAHLYQQPYLAPTEKIEKPYDAVGVPVHQQAQQPEIRLNGIEKFLAKMYNMSPEEIAWRKSLPGPYGHYHYGHHGCYGPYGPYGPPMPYGVRT